jgi:hypothetical protein
MKPTLLALPHSGRRSRALLCAPVIGAMVLVSTQPAAAAGCTPVNGSAVHSKLAAASKPNGTGSTKITWTADYTFTAAQFSSIDPTTPTQRVTPWIDTYSHLLPVTSWAGPGTTGWQHLPPSGPPYAQWRWRTVAADVPFNGYIQSVVLHEFPVTGKMKVKVKIAKHAQDDPYDVTNAPTPPLPTDGFIDDGVGDCLTTDFSSAPVPCVKNTITNPNDPTMSKTIVKCSK